MTRRQTCRRDDDPSHRTHMENSTDPYDHEQSTYLPTSQGSLRTRGPGKSQANITDESMGKNAGQTAQPGHL